MKEIHNRTGINSPTAWRLLEQDLKPEDREQAQRLLIPKLYLHGTQRKNDYDRSTEKWIKAVQKDKWGMFELLQNPTVVVGLRDMGTLTLYISDGHHRARYINRRLVPSLVFSIEQALEIINRNNDVPLLSGDYKDFMEQRAIDAVSSFSTSLPCDKYPQAIRHVRDLDSLPKVPGVRPY